MKTLANFENIEKKFENAVTSSEYQELVELIIKHKNIYVIGNGGLHYVASHMATDISRLVPDKYCFSFDSFGFITSSANDHGFDSIFKKWIENCIDMSKPALIIGLSCSGKSKNIIEAFDYAKHYDWDLFFVTGKRSTYSCSNLCINANHYHTVETFCLMLFYEIIHSLGHKCPELH